MSKKDIPPASDADETVVDMPDPSAEPAAPESEPVADAPSEADIVKDRLLRLQADFDNFRKRTARERQEWQAFATEQLIKDFLAVVDHFELGLANAEQHQTPPAVREGFKLVYEQMLGLLKKQGVTVLTAAPGAPFDPHQHEAISHLPSEHYPADTVIAETRRGYKIGEKLIRPLQVVVSSGSATGDDQ
jgi:molecular chaperone GrpE